MWQRLAERDATFARPELVIFAAHFVFAEQHQTGVAIADHQTNVFAAVDQLLVRQPIERTTRALELVVSAMHAAFAERVRALQAGLVVFAEALHDVAVNAEARAPIHKQAVVTE